MKQSIVAFVEKVTHDGTLWSGQPQIVMATHSGMTTQEFPTFIVSGGGIEFMRPWTQSVYGIPPEQVVGSSIKTKCEVCGRPGAPLQA